MRSREQFLRTYTFLDRLLNDVYGKNHYDLLPTLKRKKIPYPGPLKHSSNGIQKRYENLEFLDRFNKEDINAIMRGIATYKKSGFNVDEISDKSELDRKGNPVWAPYSDANREEYDQEIGLVSMHTRVKRDDHDSPSEKLRAEMKFQGWNSY